MDGSVRPAANAFAREPLHIDRTRRTEFSPPNERRQRLLVIGRRENVEHGMTFPIAFLGTTRGCNRMACGAPVGAPHETELQRAFRL